MVRLQEAQAASSGMSAELSRIRVERDEISRSSRYDLERMRTEVDRGGGPVVTDVVGGCAAERPRCGGRAIVPRCKPILTPSQAATLAVGGG